MIHDQNFNISLPTIMSETCLFVFVYFPWQSAQQYTPCTSKQESWDLQHSLNHAGQRTVLL